MATCYRYPVMATQMDDVVEILWRACGKLGVIPRVPFSDVYDFEAHVLQLYPAKSEAEKDEQLRLVLLAVQQAQDHHLAGAVECLKQVGRLS